MRTLPLLLLAACESEPTPAPDGAATPEVQAPTPAELELLRKGPPSSGGPFALALAKVAAEVGVGMVTCPLPGGGKARQRYGTPRDQLPEVGPMMWLEVDEATGPPWDPMFDRVLAHEQWFTGLAAPGASKGWVATLKKVYEFEFPPAAPGTTSTCTAVREVPFRTIRGKVEGFSSDPRTPAFAVPCLAKPPPVGGDGTFVIDVPAPCTTWVEQANRQSQKVRVDPGEAPFEATFVLGEPDRLQAPDLKWTAEGKGVARELLASARQKHKDALALVERVGESLADADAKKVADQWKYDLWEWNVRIDAAANALEQQKP